MPLKAKTKKESAMARIRTLRGLQCVGEPASSQDLCLSDGMKDINASDTITSSPQSRPPGPPPPSISVERTSFQDIGYGVGSYRRINLFASGDPPAQNGSDNSSDKDVGPDSDPMRNLGKDNQPRQ